MVLTFPFSLLQKVTQSLLIFFFPISQMNLRSFFSNSPYCKNDEFFSFFRVRERPIIRTDLGGWVGFGKPSVRISSEIEVPKCTYFLS